MHKRFQFSARLRLTMLFGGMFFLATAMLLVMMYLLLSQALEPPPYKHDYPPPVPGAPSAPESAEPEPTDAQQAEWDAIRREERERALRTVRYTMAGALLVTTATATGLGWYVAGRVLRPIRDITQHTRNASESTLGHRLNMQGPHDELRQLADAIDAMLGRLQASFDSQRRFAAQVSHELRTPLAIMGAEADVAMNNPELTDAGRAIAARVRQQVTRAERLVTSMMVLARSESTMLDREPVDLAGIVGDSLGEYLDAADGAEVKVELDLADANVIGDAVLLSQMAGNLIANGIRYNVPNGSLDIAVSTEDAWAVLRVSNTGPCISERDVDALFRPFRRGLDQASRREGGFGLGLAIVRSVTAAHHGTVQATPRPEGGLDVVIRIPSAPMPHVGNA